MLIVVPSSSTPLWLELALNELDSIHNQVDTTSTAVASAVSHARAETTASVPVSTASAALYQRDQVTQRPPRSGGERAWPFTYCRSADPRPRRVRRGLADGLLSVGVPGSPIALVAQFSIVWRVGGFSVEYRERCPAMFSEATSFRPVEPALHPPPLCAGTGDDKSFAAL